MIIVSSCTGYQSVPESLSPSVLPIGRIALFPVWQRLLLIIELGSTVELSSLLVTVLMSCFSGFTLHFSLSVAESVSVLPDNFTTPFWSDFVRLRTFTLSCTRNERWSCRYSVTTMVISVRVRQYYLSAQQLSAVLSAVIGFDLFSSPVTETKIHHFLYHATNLFVALQSLSV